MIKEFLTMFGWGWQCTGLILATPFGWVLAFIILVSAAKAIGSRRWPWEAWFLLGWPLMMSAVCIAYGLLRRDSRNPGDLWTLAAFLGIYLVGAAIAVYHSRGARAASVAVLSMGSFLLLGCAAVAEMTLTGDWP